MLIRSNSVALVLTAVAVFSSNMFAFGAPAKAAPRRSAPVARSSAARSSASTGNIITAAAGNNALSGAYNTYLNSLRQKVDNQWYLADGNHHVIIAMTVSNDGSVTELDISSSPKNTEAEQAASDAFNHVQPLPALPSGSGSIKLTLTFDSKASQYDNDRHLSGRIDALGGAPAAAAQPTEAQPAAMQPVDVQPAAVPPVEAQPAAVQPVDVQPAAVPPVEAQPAAMQPVEVQPAAAPPAESSTTNTQSSTSTSTDGSSSSTSESTSTSTSGTGDSSSSSSSSSTSTSESESQSNSK